MNRGLSVSFSPIGGSWPILVLAVVAVTALTLQEYGGIAYWDAVALSGESRSATDPLASFRVWWKGLGGKAPPELPAGLSKVVAAGPEKPQSADAVANEIMNTRFAGARAPRYQARSISRCRCSTRTPIGA